MSGDFEGFDARLRRIERNKRQLANGYELHMQNDGLIVARPRRSRSLGVPPRAIILFIAGVLLFKGILIASLGPLAYGERVTALGNGSIVEQAGAWVMQIDPVSAEIGARIAHYLK
ncbi:hypothetical protein [Marinibacterium sp. SX1]|uniref:hypothetical protein n=1 Tax=Marinibacterium sp. SX1 TaxID=3388424 RepID=UPI003D16B16A